MGKLWKLWKTLFSWAPKSLWMVTAAMKLKDTCSLGKKAMMKLQCILKSRDITLPTNVCLVKAKVFPVVMYRWENWTIKKAEHQRIDASNYPVGEDWCWSWSSHTLATWREEQTHWIKPWCCERLWAWGEYCDRGWDDWMASPIQRTWFCMNSRR